MARSLLAGSSWMEQEICMERPSKAARDAVAPDVARSSSSKSQAGNGGKSCCTDLPLGKVMAAHRLLNRFSIRRGIFTVQLRRVDLSISVPCLRLRPNFPTNAPLSQIYCSEIATHCPLGGREARIDWNA